MSGAYPHGGDWVECTHCSFVTTESERARAHLFLRPGHRIIATSLFERGA